MSKILRVIGNTIDDVTRFDADNMIVSESGALEVLCDSHTLAVFASGEWTRAVFEGTRKSVGVAIPTVSGTTIGVAID